MPERDAVDAGWGPFRKAPGTGVIERILWRVNQLRCMTHAEIRHRVTRALAMHAERWGLLGSGAVPSPDLAHASFPWIHPTARVDAAQYLAAADRLAAG